MIDALTSRPDDDELDTALRQHLQAEIDEPADAGFSLAVLAALPAQQPPLELRRWARWLRSAQWAGISLSACGLAAISASDATASDLPRTLATAALLGLLIFWSVPSRWSRG
jgi:hypothetical protein